MSQLSTPTASQSTLHAADGELGARPNHGAGSPAAAQPLHTAHHGRARFRLNIGRSLQLHSWLVVAVTLAGIALSTLYFFRLWPQYPAESRIYVPIFASIVFTILVAVARHKMDPKLYGASEVKQVLGLAPTVQLPDLTEVSEAVGEEHFLRLAAAIEHARKQRRLKSCMFTGTAPGVGVTTVATKVRNMFDAMGRPAVLVNASGIPVQTSRAATAEEIEVHADSERAGSEGGGCSTALLRQAPQEAGIEDESLVFTDTAPLEISPETENLARSADCVIVVMEAGVTTREQLRATTQILRRLNVGTVGFVLNRVSLAKADRAFRQSIRAMERQVRSQSGSTSAGTETARTGAMRTAGSRHFEDEPSLAAEQEMCIAAAPAQPEQAVPGPTVAARRAAPAEPEQAGVAAAPAPQPPPAARTPEAPEAPPPAPEPDSDIPWWPTETYWQPPAPAAQILWQPAKTRQAGGAGAQEAQQPASGEASDTATSRLSGLRNIFYLRGINDLHRARKEAAENQGTLAPEVEPRRPAEPRPPTLSGDLVPSGQPVPAATAAPRDVMAAPELLPPKPAGRSMGKKPARVNEPRVRLDRRDVDDEVAILPSRRGQYKRGAVNIDGRAD